MIKEYITRDLSFESIREVSAEAFGMALDVLNGKTQETDEIDKLTKDVNRIKGSISSVRAENREQAEKLLSEAILVAWYVGNPQTEGTSLRLGRIISERKVKDSER